MKMDQMIALLSKWIESSHSSEIGSNDRTPMKMDRMMALMVLGAYRNMEYLESRRWRYNQCLPPKK